MSTLIVRSRTISLLFLFVNAFKRETLVRVVVSRMYNAQYV